jgi:hypothetical protein
MVYNHDFVERNFNQQNLLRGVFTLGEERISTLEQINKINNDINVLTIQINELSTSLNNDVTGKKKELQNHEEKYTAIFWKLKTKYDDKLAGGLTGVRNNKNEFKEKLIFESTNNTSNVLPYEDLKKKAQIVFVDSKEVSNLPTIQYL